MKGPMPRHLFFQCLPSANLSSIDLWCLPSVSHGGGSPEVGEELEAKADHKVPDVSGHLGAGDEDAPKEHHQDSVEGIADVPQPADTEAPL